MQDALPRIPRGRPKTLDRDHIIKVAMESYWSDGPTAVSVNEICRRADVSKPGLYREFGNEDGLRSTVVQTYELVVLSQLYQIFEDDQPFDDALAALTDLILQDRQKMDLPKGCLLQKMRGCLKKLGPKTNDVINATSIGTQSRLKDCVERAKHNGQLSKDISTKTAAIYIDAQVSSAFMLQEAGVSQTQISEFLNIAFKGLK
jgi:TetR/AcrR family transcriptional regulator, copper-responsive repressor